MSIRDTVLSSRVRLARNYEDLPFDTADDPELAESCLTRTCNALRLAGADGGYDMILLRETGEVERRAMAERRQISFDLLRHPDTAAVLLNEQKGVSIMMNEEDHLRIQAIAPGLCLNKVAAACFSVENALSRHAAFAFDKRWGYLTAYPTSTGTGMRASVLLHLPMLTKDKRMGDVGTTAAKVGLTISGVYGEGQEALGDIYQLSNQVTLGRTEQDLIATVSAVAQQLSETETALRARALHDERTRIEDRVFRAWGILSGARLIGLDEFYEQWSAIRLGSALGLLWMPLDTLDGLLSELQDNNLLSYADEALGEERLLELRASRLRQVLGSAHEPEAM